MKICEVIECTTIVKAKNLCQKHYVKWKKYGNPLHVVQPKHRPFETCIVPNCMGDYMSKGLCRKHYYRWRLYKDVNCRRNVGIGTTHEERFWSRIDIKSPNQCWNWLGAISRGYGIVGYKSKLHRAHRLAWFYTKGTWPDKALELLHSCDNKLCCNVQHLREDTHAENMREAFARGLIVSNQKKLI